MGSLSNTRIFFMLVTATALAPAYMCSSTFSIGTKQPAPAEFPSGSEVFGIYGGASARLGASMPPSSKKQSQQQPRRCNLPSGAPQHDDYALRNAGTHPESVPEMCYSSNPVHSTPANVNSPARVEFTVEAGLEEGE